MGKSEPYQWQEYFTISCSTSVNNIVLKYIPDRIWLCNPDATQKIFVGFDQVVAENEGILVDSEKVQKVDIRANTIYAIADGGSPTLHGIAFAHKKERW